MSPDAIDRLTLADVEAMAKAWRYRQVDQENDLRREAYFIMMAQGKKQTSSKSKPKPVYPIYQQFFDYEAELRKVDQELGKNKDDRFLAVSRHLKEQAENEERR